MTRADGAGQHDRPDPAGNDGAGRASATAAVQHEHEDGRVQGYHPRRTLPLGVELSRQFRRRRTGWTLAFLAVLPFLLLAAFEIGSDGRQRSGGLVDVATSSGLNFAVFTLFSSTGFLLVVVVALFFGDTVASEASWSSLKYLLAAPVPRSRLLRQKASVSALLSLLALGLLVAISLAVGLIWYGTGDLLTPRDESLSFLAGLLALGAATAYLAVHLIWIAGAALAFSVSTDAPLGAVGGAVLVSILSQILDSIDALGSLRVWLPTHFAYAWSDLLSGEVDWADMARGAFSGLAYGTLFTIIAVRRFRTKDITS